MNYEIKPNGKDWQLIPDGNPHKNQQSKVFNLLMQGERMTRLDSIAMAGCAKLPSRCGEINDALYNFMDGPFSVSHEKVPTKHGGYVYKYFLTAVQRNAIEQQAKKLAA